MKELDLKEVDCVSGGGTCVCSSGAQWDSCPHQGACFSWCQQHGGMRFWGGPN